VSKPYIAEVQIAKWTSDGIRDAFRAAGFLVIDWPMTQHLEKVIPADRLFFAPRFSKLFGLQYKSLYKNGPDFWPLDRTQHNTLQGFKWIYYCCSELRDVTDHGLALYMARFYRSRFEFQRGLLASGLFQGSGYIRFGAFYRGLRDCRYGAKVTSQAELQDLLGAFAGAARIRESTQIGEFLLPNFERRILLAGRLF
jgi:hypothetical protein